MLEGYQQGRYQGMTEFATNLKQDRLLRRGMTVERAAAVMAAHIDVTNWITLVVRHGFTRRSSSAGSSTSPRRHCCESSEAAARVTRQAGPTSPATIAADSPTSGSPPPGCADPPTRNSPGTGEALAGRRNAARAPLDDVP